MKKVMVFLTLAVLLGVVSVTPFAANWQLFSLGPYASEMPALQGMIDAWRSLVDGLQAGGLISSSRAADWKMQGISVEHFCQTISVVFVVLGWIAALGVQTESNESLTSLEIREIAVGVAQIQHAMTNVLLDPKAQPMVETLTDIARQLHSVGDVLSSMPGQARD